MIDSSNLIKKTTTCGLCGVILAVTATGFICHNPGWPDYMFEKHEHLPERSQNFDNFRIQNVTISGTAASGVSGTYGSTNFVEWPTEGGES